MSEEKESYRLRQNGNVHRQEKQEASHEHLYRLAIGSPIIRWCERCGASSLLQQQQPLSGGAVSYVWVVIEERSAT